MTKAQLEELTLLALDASFAAGEKILEVYQNTIHVDYKTDGSPLTEADKAAHNVIVKYLESSGLPLLSEEGKSIPYEERKQWKLYWLVDPLDGTKEFIKRNGEFTVNIALMENNHPVAGVIYQPTTGVAHAGIEGVGLFKFTKEDKRELSEDYMLQSENRDDEDKIFVIASRSHKSSETEHFIDDLRRVKKSVELINAGSSLKFCLLAEGKADVYPRFAPTMEWDTAAGHALLKAVGKNIFLHPAGNEMTYNKPQLINDWFFAR